MKKHPKTAKGKIALSAFEARYWSHSDDDESILAPGAAVQPAKRFVNDYGHDQPGTRVQWPSQYTDPTTPKNPGRGHRSEAVKSFRRRYLRD